MAQKRPLQPKPAGPLRHFQGEVRAGPLFIDRELDVRYGP